MLLYIYIYTYANNSTGGLTTSIIKREAQPDWNAAAWSNFVKVYAVDEKVKRDVDNWNSAAWSNFIKSYVRDFESVKAKREENWNSAAWSNFIKSYVEDFESAE